MTKLSDYDAAKLSSLEIDWESDEKDIEAADSIEAKKRRIEVRARIHKRFPFLNEKQLELVGTLDDAIDNATPQVHLPRLRVVSGDGQEQQINCRDFMHLLTAPFLIFFVTFSAAVAIVLLNHSDTVLGSLYPYLVTLATFLASVPAIKGRYDGYFDKITTGVDAAKNRVNPAIDELEGRLTGLVTQARRQLNAFLVNIKGQLRQLTNAKTAIQVLRPDVVIPDVSDLEGYLDTSERRIRKSIEDARSQATLDGLIPWVLQSRKHFGLGVVFPVVLVMLAIQFFATWRAEVVMEPADNKWDPVIVSTQTFLIAVAQIAFSYYVTRIKRVVGYVNRKIKSINRRVNTLLKNKAQDAFHAVLDKAMSYVRARVLEVVNHVRKLERMAVDINGKAHKVEDFAGKATGTVLLLENSIESSHVASDWMQNITQFLSSMVRQIDDCTAGLVDCTGFVDDESQTKASKNSSNS